MSVPMNRIRLLFNSMALAVAMGGVVCGTRTSQIHCAAERRLPYFGCKWSCKPLMIDISLSKAYSIISSHSFGILPPEGEIPMTNTLAPFALLSSMVETIGA